MLIKIISRDDKVIRFERAGCLLKNENIKWAELQRIKKIIMIL